MRVHSSKTQYMKNKKGNKVAPDQSKDLQSSRKDMKFKKPCSRVDGPSVKTNNEQEPCMAHQPTRSSSYSRYYPKYKGRCSG